MSAGSRLSGRGSCVRRAWCSAHELHWPARVVCTAGRLQLSARRHQHRASSPAYRHGIFMIVIVVTQSIMNLCSASVSCVAMASLCAWVCIPAPERIPRFSAVSAAADVRASLVQEVDAVAREGAVGHDELARMPYLDACLKVRNPASMALTFARSLLAESALGIVPEQEFAKSIFLLAKLSQVIL